MNIKDIHIGKIIKEKLEEKSISIAKFACGINRDRTTVYNIFKQKSIDIELLIKISEILDYDFIHQVYFPDIFPKTQITIEVAGNDIRVLRKITDN